MDSHENSRSFYMVRLGANTYFYHELYLFYKNKKVNKCFGF